MPRPLNPPGRRNTGLNRSLFVKQLLLATALIALPVAAFTGYSVFVTKAATESTAQSAGLGDLSAFRAIITDVQASAAKGDLAAAKTRIKDFEIAWDDNETGLKPQDPAHWRQIDDAADAALSALRATTPDQSGVIATLAALQATLQSPAQVVQ
jgi:hypothetical protein